MNLEHLSSKLRLDIDHLQWQKDSQHLTPAQFRERFNTLAHGYCSLVTGSDLPRVERMVSEYRKDLLN